MDAADQLSDGLDFGSQDCIPLKNQYYFGVMFYRGQGVPQNYEEAAKWFSRVITGPCRQTPNQAVKESYSESGAASRRKTPAQDAEYIRSAQYYLGFMYFNGQGVAQNYDEAARLFIEAANQGHAEAQNLLGRAYYSGLGRKKNANEAVKWWRKAAEQGRLRRRTAWAMHTPAAMALPKITRSRSPITERLRSRGTPVPRPALATCTRKALALIRTQARR